MTERYMRSLCNFKGTKTGTGDAAGTPYYLHIGKYGVNRIRRAKEPDHFVKPAVYSCTVYPEKRGGVYVGFTDRYTGQLITDGKTYKTIREAANAAASIPGIENIKAIHDAQKPII